MEQSLLNSVFVFLAAAILIVPLIKLSGLGSVIGYLFAGILIGPSVAGLISEPETILHFSEFGVVMMLFLIGLELKPKELWHMRVRLLGLGGLQVGITILIVSSAFMMLSTDTNFGTALVIGMALSLSSTAVAIQVMQDRKMLMSDPGQSAFSVLLFQDVIVIAMIASVPLLAEQFINQTSTIVADLSDGHQGAGAKGLSGWGSGWYYGLAILGVFGGMILAGRLLLNPLFKIVARSKVRETFTAIALALVIGAALLMDWLGLSAALGAFFAGIVLADSNYRHQLERDLEPFKALLLGLFFISVGMSLDLNVIAASPLTIFASAALLLLLKFSVLLVVGRIFGLTLPSNFLFACLISQAGEFGFVLFQFASAEGLMDPTLVSKCNAVIAISMAVTPLMLIARDRLSKALLKPNVTTGEAPEDKGHKVLILGFGRVGQVAARLLHSQDIETTLIDHDGDHIEFVRPFGNKVYYGDAADTELLRTAGAETADVVLICIDDREKATETAENLKQHFPNTKVIARARNRTHMFDLMALDIDFIERETVRGSLAMGRRALEFLGVSEERSIELSDMFLEHDYKLIEETRVHRNDVGTLIDKSNASREFIRQTLNAKPSAAGEDD
ncbi:MAG: cation:proton antiporter [Arenicella sp.]|nr:cation:proton antiporter [Arenicella sp.]